MTKLSAKYHTHLTWLFLNQCSLYLDYGYMKHGKLC